MINWATIYKFGLLFSLPTHASPESFYKKCFSSNCLIITKMGMQINQAMTSIFGFPTKICETPRYPLPSKQITRSQFRASRSLEPTGKSLNMLRISWNDQIKLKNKIKTEKSFLVRNQLTIHKIHNLASKCRSP